MDDCGTRTGGTGARTEVRVLGPIEIVVGGTVQPLRPMARRLLAVLAAASGRVVRAERVADQLWPQASPSTAEKTLQTHVMHLRRGLDTGAVAYRAGGYCLNVAIVDLDSERLAILVASAESAIDRNEFETAHRALGWAVTLLRGEAFDEFATEEFAIAEVARLRELGSRAREMQAECAIRRGRAASSVSDLQRLVVEHPLRESAWVLLIRALVCSDRNGEAIATAQRACATVKREVGTDPGAALLCLAEGLLGAAGPSC